MLRHSPRLTLASLAARRANARKSTGPRTDRGKAWSCLNALRHGRRSERWTFRDKIERTGDPQALLLFDWIFVKLMDRWKPPTEWEWRLTAREAVRAWCFLTGRMLLPRLKGDGLRTGLGPCPTYRYGERLICPTDLRITDKNGMGIRFRNPTPSRRKHVKDSWVPAVEMIDPPPRLPQARRVRGSASGPQAASRDGGDGARRTEIHSPTKLECGLESSVCREELAAATRHSSLVTRHLPLVTSGDRGNETTGIHGPTKLECGLESGACPEQLAGGASVAPGARVWPAIHGFLTRVWRSVSIGNSLDTEPSPAREIPDTSSSAALRSAQAKERPMTQ